MSNSSIDIILAKIQAYIRKYYAFEIFKGLIYLAIYTIASLLVFTFLEHLYRFSTIGRSILFFAFTLSFIGISYFFILRNILRMMAIGKVMAYKDAAKNIGAYFKEIDDKLLNMLQLKESLGETSNELALASIEQKVDAFKSFSFKQAVEFKDLKLYLKYLSLPFIVLVLVLLISPSMITDSSKRIIQFNEEFEEPAPFDFIIENKEMQTLQYLTYDLKVKVEGKALPKEVYLWKDGIKSKLNKIDNNHYTYTFANPTKSIDFKLESLGFSSRPYTIKVVPKPIVENFKVKIDYPRYLNKKADELNNLGNFTVPEGTKVDWSLFTKNVNKLKFDLGDTILPAASKGDNQFSFQLDLKESLNYSIIESNNEYESPEPSNYFIKVIPDEYPSISMNVFEDSLNIGTIYFTGDISDDYGFQNLSFYYKTTAEEKYIKQHIDINKSLTKDQFYFVMDLKGFGFELGTELDYYFEVRDNDALNGYKSSKTSLYTYRLKSKDEIVEEYKNVSASLKDNMDKSIEKALQLQSRIQELKEKMLSKKELNWSDKKALEQIRKEQEALKKALEEILKEKQQIKKQQETIGNENDELKQKEELLEKMLEDVMKNDVMEMMEKIQDMMDKLKKEDVMEEMDKMSKSNEDISENLEKLQELYKQLEFEYQFDEAVKEMEQMAKKQEELANKTDKEGNKLSDEKKQELVKEQEQITKELEQFKKKMDALEKLNKQLEKPNQSFNKNEQEQESIQQRMTNAMQQLQDNKGKNASQQQQDAAQEMENLAQKMQQQQDQMEMEQMAMDYETLRQILDNVLTLSFDQEHLMDEGSRLNRNSPNYREVVLNQYKIKDNMRIVEDSLKSLSKRVFELESFVTEELNNLNTSIEYAIDAFEQLKFGRAVAQQQYAITSFNNIALMLNESLNNMQKKMNSKKKSSGSKSCNNPSQGKGQQSKGKSKQEIEKLRKMNEELTKQMHGMKKAGEQGKMSSQGIAKLAKQQAELREMIEQFNRQHNKDGKKSVGGLEEILEKMEQNEKDIVNKNLSEALYLRQQEIETRMLKAESAVREQEKNDEREADRPENVEVSEPPVFKEYKRKKERQVELLRSIPPKFSPFYKKIVNEYFKAITN